ncbi:MAG: hypothetical protein NWE95_07215 [Candidatus Bathyarchaeota archaeon]|nr:hypothetical protein [Candidatus Bathyarchaeota archaeon]
MFKVTIKCRDEAENLAKRLDRDFQIFKVWVYDGAAYASLGLKSICDLAELRKLAGEGFRCIKIEKMKKQWRI